MTRVNGAVNVRVCFGVEHIPTVRTVMASLLCECAAWVVPKVA